MRRPPTSLASQQAQAAHLQQLERELGGRAALIVALQALPSPGKDLRYLRDLLADPTNDRIGLAEVCTSGHVTIGELLRAFQEGTLALAHLKATKAIGEALPRTVAHAMERSAPYENDCPTCQGTTTVTPEPSDAEPNPSPIDCPTCRATGKLRYDPEIDWAKLGLTLGGLLKTGGGIQIAVNQQTLQIPQTSPMATFEAVQAAIDEVLYGQGGAGGGIVEAETVEAGEPAPSPEEAP